MLITVGDGNLRVRDETAEGTRSSQFRVYLLSANSQLALLSVVQVSGRHRRRAAVLKHYNHREGRLLKVSCIYIRYHVLYINAVVLLSVIHSIHIFIKTLIWELLSSNNHYKHSCVSKNKPL